MTKAVVKIVRSLTPSWLRQHVQTVDDEHKHIALNIITVAMFLVAAKLIVAVKEMAIAWRYGVSSPVDAYLFVFSFINWPIMVWFSVLSVVLVPLMARIQHDSPDQLPAFRAELLGLTVVLGATLSLFACVGLPILLRSSWVGLPTTTRQQAVGMAPFLAMLALPGLLIGLLSSWMLAGRRHANTFLESIPALTILISVLFISGSTAEPLIFGTLLGFAFHSIGLAVPLIRAGEIELPRFQIYSPYRRVFWQGFGVMLAGQALMAFTNVVDQLFAVRLGEGNIAALGYANRLLTLFLAMGATIVARATLPVFSDMQAKGSLYIRNVASRWALIFLVIGVAVMFFGWWLAPWLVRVLFERGAFTAQNTSAVTNLFRCGMVQVPFYFSALIFVSYLSSRGQYRWILLSGMVGLCSKMIGNYLLVSAFGIAGIPLATAIAYGLNFLLLACVFKAQINWGHATIVQPRNKRDVL